MINTCSPDTALRNIHYLKDRRMLKNMKMQEGEGQIMNYCNNLPGYSIMVSAITTNHTVNMSMLSSAGSKVLV